MSSQGHRLPGVPPLHYPNITNQNVVNYQNITSQPVSTINYQGLRDQTPIAYPAIRDHRSINFGTYPGVREQTPLNYAVGPAASAIFPNVTEESRGFPQVTESAINYSTINNQSSINYPCVTEQVTSNYPTASVQTTTSLNFQTNSLSADQSVVSNYSQPNVAYQQRQHPAPQSPIQPVVATYKKPSEREEAIICREIPPVKTEDVTEVTLRIPKLAPLDVIASPEPVITEKKSQTAPDRPVKKRKISNEKDSDIGGSTSNVQCFKDKNQVKLHPGTSKVISKTTSDNAKIKLPEQATTSSSSKISEEEENSEHSWLPCSSLPEEFKDESYIPPGDIMVNCDSESGMEAFDEHIINFMKQNNIPGLSLCISRKRAILYSQCYGWANKEKRLEPSHMFRIASVSKIITALGILHLCDNGKLRVASKVFGDKGIFNDLHPTKKGDKRMYNITVKMLLQHTAGWDRDVAGDPLYWKDVGKEMGVSEPLSPMDLLQYMMDQKLQFNPGSKSVYSNFGYLVLGLIIERISGRSYEEYITDIMAYASLSGMCVGKTRREEKHPLEVDYYAGPRGRQVDSVFPNEGKVEAPYGGSCMENSAASGGWLATPTHLVRLSHAMEQGHIIKPTTVRKMKTRPDFAKEDKLTWYGMGVDVAFNGKEYGHSGHLDGATSILTHSRDGYTWAVSCNYWPADSDYNSLIQYGLCLVKGWTRLTPFITPQFDGATHLGMYAFSLNLTREEFIQKTKFAFGEGYRIHWINSYTYQGLLLFNIIWVIDGKDGRFLFDIDVSNMQSAIAKQKSNGYCPTHLELYVRNNKVNCCIIFLKSASNFKVTVHTRVNRVEDEILDKYAEGWTPNIVCICPLNKEKWVAVLYHENPERNWVKVNMTSDQYTRTHSKQAHYGHMPVYVRVHQGDKGPLFTAIWENPGPYLFTTDNDMSKFKLLGDFVQVENEDFLPHIIIGYEMEGTQRYTGVFVKAVEPCSMATWHGK